jgi:hypothetical protein
MLPSPSPVRTARAPFDASGPSSSDARFRVFRTQFGNVRSLTFTIPPLMILQSTWLLRAHFVTSHKSFAFPVLKVLPQVSRDQEPAGSPHPFGSGQIPNPYPHHYGTAFAFSGIPHPLRRRIPLRVAFPFRGTHRASQVPLMSQDKLGAASPPGESRAADLDTILTGKGGL